MIDEGKANRHVAVTSRYSVGTSLPVRSESLLLPSGTLIPNGHKVCWINYVNDLMVHRF